MDKIILSTNTNLILGSDRKRSGNKSFLHPKTLVLSESLRRFIKFYIVFYFFKFDHLYN